MSIPAFPKIFTLGMKETERLLNGPIEVTEKVDGSQFSFGIVGDALFIRSKGAIIHHETPDGMFAEGVEFVKSIENLLPADVVFHGEYLKKPRHNTLEYERVPNGHIMLFGARRLPDTFADFGTLEDFAKLFGCETVPPIYYGPIEGKLLDQLNRWLDYTSGLGKAKVEGVVLKNYNERVLIGGQVIPILCAKYVSENFKEKHKTGWSKSNPSNEVLLAEAFRTEARWRKAVEHLRDNGTLENSPRDIGALLKELHKDLEEESLEEIKNALWKIFRKQILRTVTRGFPEWYKQKLVEDQK